MRRRIRHSSPRPSGGEVVRGRSRPSYRASQPAQTVAIQGAGGSVERIALTARGGLPACATCGAPLPGPSVKWASLRRYCSVPCRRRKEYARRTWDRLQGWIRAAEMNATWPVLTPAQREAHRRHGEGLRHDAGARP